MLTPDLQLVSHNDVRAAVHRIEEHMTMSVDGEREHLRADMAMMQEVLYRIVICGVTLNEYTLLSNLSNCKPILLNTES